MAQHPDPLKSAAGEAGASEDSSSFGDILNQFERQHQGPEGSRETLRGTVLSVSGDSVYVDIGRKREGVLTAASLSKTAGPSGVKPGDTVVVAVTGRDPDGYYQLSTIRVERPKDWQSLEAAFSAQRTITAQVEEVIKGGLRVNVGVRAFLPASRSGAREAQEMETLVGQEIQCRIIQIDIANEDVVVDRRVVLEEQARLARDAQFGALREGAVMRGTVRTLTEFGAFIDLGGVEGLLHVTEMAWHRVGKPEEVVQPGDEVEVKILRVDPAGRRISLSRKQLLPDPWSTVGEKYRGGERARGKVVRLTEFGAFIELEPGVEGLVHFSEMSWSKKARKPADILNSGEMVEVAVLSVNSAERRIALGLKQVLGDPWDQVDTGWAPGTVIEKPVVSLTRFGAFVELEEGIEGMIHIGDMSRDKRLNHPNEVLTVGQPVRAVVLEIDRERRRLRLGMKQLEPTTVDEFIAEHQLGELVSGRIVETASGRARVEVAEGVIATCRLPAASASKEEDLRPSADLSQLTSMLSARWKGGGETSAAPPELARVGQIRRFRILTLNAGEKSVELELAG